MCADILVAILLVATIVSSVKLSRRIAKLKADEAGLRQIIQDLVVASTTAERAIGGLRSTLDECDRTLAERLATAERSSAELAAHVQAGEAVLARIGAIVANSRAAPAREAAREPARKPANQPANEPAPWPSVAPEARIVPVAAKDVAKDVAKGVNGDRLGAALAAANALSERALERVRARAA